MTVPYENATSGASAREEITKILRRFRCASVGFMDDFAEASVVLAFTHRGRQVQLRASAAGWAALYLKDHPHNSRSRKTRQQHESDALAKGLIAVNSVLRDWIKGSVTAVECGLMSFEEVFAPQIRLPNGERLIERAMKALPPADGMGERLDREREGR